MNETTNEVTDVLGAVKIALDYLAKKGMVVFSREVRSVFRNSGIWVVEIESEKFIGSIIVYAKTGEVAIQLPL